MYPMWPTRNVYPSGADLAALAVPMVPPAPPTFSIRIVCFSSCETRFATLRAMASVGPPAANGTIQVIARAG